MTTCEGGAQLSATAAPSRSATVYSPHDGDNIDISLDSFARERAEDLDWMARMASDDKNELRTFVGAWEIAAARLEALRREDLRNVDVAHHIMALDGAFEATLTRPIRKSSGLVEQ